MYELHLDQDELLMVLRWAEKEMRAGTFLPDVQRAEGIKAKVSQAFAYRSDQVQTPHQPA